MPTYVPKRVCAKMQKARRKYSVCYVYFYFCISSKAAIVNINEMSTELHEAYYDIRDI